MRQSKVADASSPSQYSECGLEPGFTNNTARVARIAAFASSMDHCSALVPTRVWAHPAAGRRTTTADEHSSHFPPYSASLPAIGPLFDGGKVGCAHASGAALHLAWAFQRHGSLSLDPGWRSSPLPFPWFAKSRERCAHSAPNYARCVATSGLCTISSGWSRNFIWRDALGLEPVWQQRRLSGSKSTKDGPSCQLSGDPASFQRLPSARASSPRISTCTT